MFDFLNKFFNAKQPKKDGVSSADTKKEEEHKDSLPQEPEHEDKPTEQNAPKREGPTYEEWRRAFPKLLELMTNYLENAIPGDTITEPGKHVFISADVYGKYIDKIYMDISQASDGHMTLKIDSGKRGSDILVGNYFFEAGRTKEEIFSFLRSPEMPDILDKTVTELDEKFRNR